MSELRYGRFGGERERSYRATNFDYYDPWRVAGDYEMPVIERCNVVPDHLIGFNYVKTAGDTDCGVHFFIDDYQFERIWRNPRQSIPPLARFQCVQTPDFSRFIAMPMAMKIWNTYRSRMIGQIMQREGLCVIPTLSWAEEATYAFCYDGIEPGGAVAVSTVGVARNKEARQLWFRGMDEALRRLEPSMVLCYGMPIGYDFGEVPVKFYEPRKFAGYKAGRR